MLFKLGFESHIGSPLGERVLQLLALQNVMELHCTVGGQGWVLLSLKFAFPIVKKFPLENPLNFS